MPEFLSQFGIDAKLLLSQGVNFLIALVILTIFVYKPLLKILEERRKKIELGLKGAKEVERRLSEIEEVRSHKILESEKLAFEIVEKAEDEARRRSEGIVSEAQVKAEEILYKASQIEEQRRMEALARLSKEARALVRAALIKTVSLKPEAVDEALITKALSELSKDNKG
jgi:F-type H+-transporting ATPase subunit b